MTGLSILVKKAGHALQSNSPAILTALGVSGAITTAYLAAKAGYKMAQDEMLYKLNKNDPTSVQDKVKTYWPLFVPAGVSGVLTVTAIIGASKVSARKTAAITAAYSIGEKAFTEYKDKVVEQIGEKKEQAIRDEVAADRVRDNPPGKVIIAAGGTVLCFEQYTGRYFQSDIETLRKAQNEVNAKLIREDQASLTDFYYIISIPQTTYSSDMGWTSSRLMELMFSTVMSEDERPCIAFEYNYIKPLD